MRRSWLKLLVLAAMLTPSASWAYDFIPTMSEFASWPKYCQARYVGTGIGSRGEFTSKVTPAEKRIAEASIGAETFLHVHHHCAGLAWLARARLEGDPQKRKHMLNRAISESMYTLRNVTPASPLYTSILANLARTEQAQGNIPGAENYYDMALKANPTDPKTYVGLALLYRDTKRMQLARETLDKGLTATDNKSIEIHYSLGLICLELKDKDCAVEHARVAYSAGYPLPGLRDKLSKSGLWTE
jgi:tetratricopeptide (TPR) repeat protein